MKNYNHSGKFRALAVAVVVLLALTIFTAGAGGNSAGGALGFITAPLQSVSSSVMRAIGDALGVNDYSAEFLALQERVLTAEPFLGNLAGCAVLYHFVQDLLNLGCEGVVVLAETDGVFFCAEVVFEHDVRLLAAAGCAYCDEHQCSECECE